MPTLIKHSNQGVLRCVCVCLFVFVWWFVFLCMWSQWLRVYQSWSPKINFPHSLCQQRGSTTFVHKAEGWGKGNFLIRYTQKRTVTASRLLFYSACSTSSGKCHHHCRVAWWFTFDIESESEREVTAENDWECGDKQKRSSLELSSLAWTFC